MAAKQAWKGALLISGEPGTGKTRWVKEEAALARAKLFRWNARTDRSLREGREILHQQVRSKERLFVWIEGADDLTQEAQAFLRRILETAAQSVTCVLEVRELWKLSPPILSRCTVVSMRSEHSYRVHRNNTLAAAMGILEGCAQMNERPAWNEIVTLRKNGCDPYKILDLIVAAYGAEDLMVNECIRAIGGGSSPWIQISHFLFRAPPPPRPISV
jgi:DNA polymerase III delta prime subunit